ncbi:MAG: hypothetical protein R6X13_01265, partial [bacterium]
RPARRKQGPHMTGPAQQPDDPRPLVTRPRIGLTMVIAAAGLLLGIVAPMVAFLVIRGRSAPGGPGVLPVLVVAGVAVLLVLVVLFLARRAARRVTDRFLRETGPIERGIPAQATVISMADTGLTVNKNPRVRLELDVRTADGHNWRAVTVATVSRVATGHYLPGAVVSVVVDPLDPQRVALADIMGQAPAARAPDPALVQRIEEVSRYNDRLHRSGEPARAHVVRVESIGAAEGGELLSLVVRVLPVGAEPFLAEAAGVVDAQAAARCRPGSEVRVRFDSSDQARVGLDRV